MIGKLGPLFTSVAGSISGTTFQRSGPGTLVRAKPLPTYRNTSPSQTARQRVHTLNSIWLAMDPNDVKDWQTFALTQTFKNRFGDVVPSTAYKAYMRCNSGSYMSAAGDFNMPITLTAPLVLKGTLPTLPKFVLNTGTGHLFLTSSDGTVDADTKLTAFATRPRRPIHRRETDGQPIDPNIGVFGSGTALPIDLTSAYVAVHGRVPNDTVGEGAFLRVLALDSTTHYPALQVILPLDYV